MNEIEAQELAGEAWAAGCKLAEELLDAEWKIAERALINVLRKIGKGSDPVLLAAKEKIRRLRKALEPFAAVGRIVKAPRTCPPEEVFLWSRSFSKGHDACITLKDVYCARDALEA